MWRLNIGILFRGGKLILLLNIATIIIKMLLCTVATAFLLYFCVPTADYFTSPITSNNKALDCFSTAHLYVCQWLMLANDNDVMNSGTVAVVRSPFGICRTCICLRPTALHALRGLFVVCVLLLQLCKLHANTVMAVHWQHIVFSCCFLVTG